jgi:hypothetical protein
VKFTAPIVTPLSIPDRKTGIIYRLKGAKLTAPADLQRLAQQFSSELGTTPRIRRLTTAEIEKFWTIIPFDNIHEPVYILENGSRQLLACIRDIGGPAGCRVWWVDALNEYDFGEKTSSNQRLEPTPASVMPAANAPRAPSSGAAHPWSLGYMVRIIRLGPRYYHLVMLKIIAFGGLLPCMVGTFTDRWGLAAVVATCGVLLALVLYAPRSLGESIAVDQSGISIRFFVKVTERIRFGDIDYSIVCEWEEIGWPGILEIYRRGKKGKQLTLLLKLNRKEDAAWLLTIPELRMRREHA